MTSFPHVLVIGAGRFGMALALTATRAGSTVTVWGRNAASLKDMHETRAASFFPRVTLPTTMKFETDSKAALQKADAVIFALPGQALRSFCQAHHPYLHKTTPLLIAAKVFEEASGKLPSEVLEELSIKSPLGVLAGAHFAHEIAENFKARGLVAGSTECFELFHRVLQVSSTTILSYNIFCSFFSK